MKNHKFLPSSDRKFHSGIAGLHMLNRHGIIHDKNSMGTVEQWLTDLSQIKA
jgi:hypothetical protein